MGMRTSAGAVSSIGLSSGLSSVTLVSSSVAFEPNVTVVESPVGGSGLPAFFVPVLLVMVRSGLSSSGAVMRTSGVPAFLTCVVKACFTEVTCGRDVLTGWYGRWHRVCRVSGSAATVVVPVPVPLGTGTLCVYVPG